MNEEAIEQRFDGIEAQLIDLSGATERIDALREAVQLLHDVLAVTLDDAGPISDDVRRALDRIDQLAHLAL